MKPSQLFGLELSREVLLEYPLGQDNFTEKHGAHRQRDEAAV